MEQNELNCYKNKLPTNRFIIHKLITTLIVNGKKKSAKKLLFESYKSLNNKNKKKLTSVLIRSLINCLSVLSVKTLRNKNRKKFNNKYIPFFILHNHRTRLAVKMLLKKSHSRNFKSSKLVLCDQLLHWSKLENTSLKIKEDKQKIVFANKKFANYRWF